MLISDWSSYVCSSDLKLFQIAVQRDDLVLVLQPAQPLHDQPTQGRADKLGQLGRVLCPVRNPCQSLHNPPEIADGHAFVEQRLEHLRDRLERQRLGDIADKLGCCRMQGVEQLLPFVLTEQLAGLALEDLVDVRCDHRRRIDDRIAAGDGLVLRSEEHTPELQPLMRIPYAVFCLTTHKASSHRPNTRLNHKCNITTLMHSYT